MQFQLTGQSFGQMDYLRGTNYISGDQQFTWSISTAPFCKIAASECFLNILTNSMLFFFSIIHAGVVLNFCQETTIYLLFQS